MEDNNSSEDILKENGNSKCVENSSTVSIDDDSKMLTKLKGCRTYCGIVIKVGLLLLLLAYFIWATVYQLEQNKYTTLENNISDTACSGYGFLLILYCIIAFSLFYSFALKPFILPLFCKIVWTPLKAILSKVKYGSIIFYVIFFAGILIYLILDTQDNRDRLIPLSGLFIFLGVGFLLCPYKTKISWRAVIWGMILQFVFGLLTLRWPVGANIFDCAGQKVNTFLNYSVQGAAFAYGEDLVYKQAVFAFAALSAIYFLGFVVNILYYYGIMQNIVSGLGNGLQWIMGTSICESVYSAGNIFLGLSESPFLLKPYLNDLTDSEIHTLMTSGFASVSGSTLAAYISFGANPAYLITASVMSAPAALCFSKLMYPEIEEIKVTNDKVKLAEMKYDSILEAATRGAVEGVNIVLGVVSSIIAFLATIYFINGVLTWMGSLVGYTDPDNMWTVDLIVGKMFTPVSFVMGVPWEECEKVGQLLGLKTMINEFVAYQRMQTMVLSERAKTIATFAICGFSNPGSVGITVSCLSTLAPRKKDAVSRLVFSAFFGGALVCCMTACIAGVLVS